MSKVFYITVVPHEHPTGVYFGGDQFFVLGEDAEDAIAHLREQIKKYYFKAKLSNKSSDDPKRLGERIIVEQNITDLTADAPLDAEDYTAMAYLYKEDRRPLWVDWDVTIEDTM